MFSCLIRPLSQQRPAHTLPFAFFTTYSPLRSKYPTDAAEGASESVNPYKEILIESHEKVGLLTLNRPKALNALSSSLFHEINDALERYDNDPDIGAIVITGNERAFAAGADIKEMQDKTFAEVYKANFLGHWGRIIDIRKPIIAAVNGFALGGGCELAMSCDIIYAGEKATFGQPEIKLGILPGAGGTQRLTRAIGKSKAMEIILSGKNFTAEEAEKWGLVSKVLPVDKVLEEAIKLGQQIANLSQPAVQAVKESINNGIIRIIAEGRMSFREKVIPEHFCVGKTDCFTRFDFEYHHISSVRKNNNSRKKSMASKKRSYRKRVGSSDDEQKDTNKQTQSSDIMQQQQEVDSEVSETIEDLIELRKYRRRPQGIDVEKLSKGDVKLKKKKKDDDPWKLNSGGLVDIEAVKAAKEEEEEETGEQRKIMLDSFTKQTNALDIDKHMMAFIEEEMRKRRGGQQSTTLSKNEDEVEANNKPLNPEDELFQPPDHLRIESKPISEGNVQLSTTMLTAIPEVDLGIDVRLKNIEETEKAKRRLLEERHQKPTEDKNSLPGTNFATNNRFFRNRQATSDEQGGRGRINYNKNEQQSSDTKSVRDQSQQSQHYHQNKSNASGSGQRREMATDDIVAERFKKRLRR
ncbi:13082_t:CDS:10 [Ambispora leptoticha]|uniref:13082_t:CDS:1 n=1 Tax=Ambispora leptoticha TaxID=144679 RepID=A0A9N8ZUE9_9GLOM|nr:13082_t:CDS:10 [Ambispora leptoticha]